jgi:hypothetical protein
MGSVCGSAGEGKKRLLRVEEDGNTYEDRIMKTHQTLFEKGGRRKMRNGNISEGVNLFKVHRKHV